MGDIWDERYQSCEGLRFWPNEELVRFLGKTYMQTWAVSARNQSVLDLGSGTGCNSWLLYEAGFDVEACDRSLASYEIMKQYAVHRRFSFHWTPAELPSLSQYQDQQFDLVIDCQTIQHLSANDHLTAYAEIMRVLKSGGRFWSMHWCGAPLAAEKIYGGHYPELLNLNAVDMLMHLEEAGFILTLPYYVTREYPALDQVGEWAIAEARKP